MLSGKRSNTTRCRNAPGRPACARPHELTAHGWGLLCGNQIAFCFGKDLQESSFDAEEQIDRVETNSGCVCLDAWHGQQGEGDRRSKLLAFPPFPKSNCSKSAIGQGCSNATLYRHDGHKWLSAWLLDSQPSAAMKCFVGSRRLAPCGAPSLNPSANPPCRRRRFQAFIRR